MGYHPAFPIRGLMTIPESELDAVMTPPPVFVGGTGRSGTTVVADLIGHHSSYHFIPIEVRLHVSSEGLFDALSADMSPERFAERLVGGFYKRKGPGGQARGLHQILDKETVAAAADLFVSEFASGRFVAGRRLMRRLLDPLAAEAGKAAWVEMTPGNVGVASKIARIFPEMKMVHTVRDGRDVASSVMAKEWGPSNMIDGLFWWSERLRDAEAQARMIDDRKIYIAKFDELIFGRRATAFKLLTRFLDLDPEDDMSAFFDSMTRGKAHLGRWRNDVTEAEAHDIDGLYRSLYDELRAAGLSCIPVEPGTLEEDTRRRAQPPS